MTDAPWIFTDVSYLAHRARYAVKDIPIEDMPTGILFGFFEQLWNVCNHWQLESNKLCLFFDSKKSYRAEVYPEYKSKRHESRTEEEIQQINVMHDQLKLLKKHILPAIGIPLYRQAGLESDDLMAAAAEHFIGESERKAVIVTSDGDLYQCITSAVHWFDPFRDVYYDPISFHAKKGIIAREWGYVKAYAGCATDSVAGIKGVGEKTAIKYLLEQLPEHHKTFEAMSSEEGRKIFERNKKLVILPHTMTETIILKEPEYNPDAFFDMCERYGLVMYLNEDRMKEWRRFFHGTPKQKTRRRNGKGKRKGFRI